MLSSPVAVILPWTTLINFVSQTKVREGGKVAQRNIAKLDLKKTPATRFLEFCLLRFFSCYIIFSSSFFYPLGVQTASVKISLTWDENLWRNHIPKLTTLALFSTSPSCIAWTEKEFGKLLWREKEIGKTLISWTTLGNNLINRILYSKNPIRKRKTATISLGTPHLKITGFF